MAGLKREIGPIGAAFIALNGIVGAGVFAMPQALVEGAGGASAYLILVFGAAMVFVAVVFGELAARFDNTGGPVAYANAAFGRFAGFQAGWVFYFARVAAMAANANVLLTYAATFTPGVDQGLVRIAVLLLLIVAFAAINIVSVKSAMRTLNAFTILKVAPLIILTLWGLYAFGDHAPPPSLPDMGATESVGLLLLYAFVGFEIATVTAGETRDPQRAIPRALVLTILAMTALYFLVQLAYVSIMQGASPEGAALAAAATKLSGPIGASAISLAAIISIGGNMFGSMMTGPRLTFAMAEEGSLPRWLAAVSERFATPANSIALYVVIAGVLATSGAFVALAVMSSLARMLLYLLCAAALLKLRGADAPAKRTFAATALRIAAPTVTFALCIWAAAQANADAWRVLGAFVLGGTLLYALMRWRAGQGSPI